MEKGGELMENATRNKWLKYRFMETRQLLPYLPETRLMTRDSLWNLIKKYRHVIVKPIKGSRGSGVIQVSSIGNGEYAIHYENRKMTIKGKENTYQYLKRIMGDRRYVVQRKISRPTVNKRPFDMRVVVQRRRYSRLWEVTGKIAKIAGKGYIVSNISRSNGTVMPVDRALKKSSIRNLSTKTLQSKIDRVAKLTARRLESFFEGHRIYGLDMALDKNGHVWIIEANLFPILSHFRKLKNKTMYYRIMKYKND
ncbi:YheC/YheD family protein [Laceyella putida]|uniref:YheC/YheD family protein n=1 Tax=Laceyella putida TaxID=110101 RepID=A0ABW2RNE2_9BACL